MSEQQRITATFDPATYALVERVAAARGLSPEAYAAAAIKEYVTGFAAFEDFIRAGEEALDRGDYLTQDQMRSWIENRHRKPDAA